MPMHIGLEQVISRDHNAEMLTILVKTIANTDNNTFVSIIFTVCYIQQHSYFFHGHLLIKKPE